MIALLAAVVGVFVLSKISGSPIFIFGKTTMWVMTDSMNPTIPERSYILVEKVEFKDIEEGDIIAFRSTDPTIFGQINTHRVIVKTETSVITKGDHNSVDDGAYSAKPENIVGRYVKNLPVMTFLGRIILSDIGFVVVIGIFLVLVLVCYVPDIKNALKEKDENDEEKRIQKEVDKLFKEEMKRRKANGENKENDSPSA